MHAVNYNPFFNTPKKVLLTGIIVDSCPNPAKCVKVRRRGEREKGLAFGMLGLLTVLVWAACIVPTWAVLDVHVSIYSLHVLTISSSPAPEIHMVR